MKFLKFENTCTNDYVVFLHGWGASKETFLWTKKYFENFNLVYVDFSGFGESIEPEKPLSVFDYVQELKALLDKFKIDLLILVGHSFGGKVSLVYSSKYKVEKLVCLASPYCKELKKLPLKNRIYKKIKLIPGLGWLAKIMASRIGSTDYKNASEVMRGVLVKSVNLDLTLDVQKIKCPTLLVWGTNDTAVPINRAYELEKLISDAGVVKYEGATHYAYLERLNHLITVMDSFFKVGR